MAHDEKLDLLRRIPLFSSFGNREMTRLGSLADEVTAEDGAVLVRQGGAGHDMMVIVSGAVRVERDGEEINRLGAGDFFGEIAIIQEGPRTATVIAEGPVRLLVVSHRDFHSMMEEFPGIAAQVMETLAARIRANEPQAVH